MNMRNLIMAATALASGLCAGQAWGATIQSVGSGFWDDGATWGGNVPTNTDDVIITNTHTVAIRDVSTHYVSNLTIQAGGVLSHTNNSSSELYKCILALSGNLTLDAGGEINVDGRGYSVRYSGPGATGAEYAGAGYGGVGGYHNSYPTAGGTTYGLITAPTNCGSAGGTGPGGGAIILSVGGMTALNGRMLARGSSVSYQGSGGAVFLITGTLSGSGTIDAGVIEGSQVASGGGGRIAVILTKSTDFGAVRMQAYSVGASHAGGSGGTIYLQHKDHVAGQGRLIVDNNGLSTFTLQNGKAASSYSFSEIVLTNNGVLSLDANDTLNITGTAISGSPVNRNDGIYLSGGYLTVPEALSISNHYFIGIGHTNPPFSPAVTALTVKANGNLRSNVPYVLNGSLTVEDGGIVDHSGNGSTENNKLNLTINGSLDIQAGGAIDVDGLGYSGMRVGPGAPGLQYASAGYGGVAGFHNDYPSPGSTYGSLTAPTNCGSSAGDGGAGGGAAILTANGATTLNGKISARCASARYSGAGGSVFLTTGTLSGNGTIDAGIQTHATLVTAGGGGRIAVILTNGNDFGSVRMRAYTLASENYGSPGTIYTQTRDQGPGNGALRIDANNIAPASLSSTLVGPLVRDATVGMVVVTNAAKLAVSNATLTVQGDWVNRAAFVGQAHGTVAFAGTNAATIYTNNTFFNFTCTNAGKTLMFEAGRTNTVTGLLKLGASQPGQMVTLQSTMNGIWSYLTLVPGGTQQIARVNVKDNNAGGGQTLLAGGGSANGGNNINWQFPPSGTMFMVR